MALRKHLYSRPWHRRVAIHILFWGAPIFISMPEWCIPLLSIATGDLGTAAWVYFAAIVVHTQMYGWAVRILLFEDVDFFHTHWVGRPLGQGIRKIRAKIRGGRKNPIWRNLILPALVCASSIVPGGSFLFGFSAVVLDPRWQTSLALYVGVGIRILIGYSIMRTFLQQ